MALTDTAIRKLRPADKPFKLGDTVYLSVVIPLPILPTLFSDLPKCYYRSRCIL